MMTTRTLASRIRWAVALLAFVVVPCAAHAQSGVVEYYHLDAVGSVRAVTAEDGSLLRLHDFKPFGEEITAPSTADRKLFTGQERDHQTGLDYVGARYYRPDLGRFTTVDPGHVNGETGDSQSWGPYASARNNPLKYIDPEGLAYRVVIDGYDAIWFLDDREFEWMMLNPELNPGISFNNGIITAGGKTVGPYQHFGDRDAPFALAGDLAAFGLRREVQEMAEGAVTTAITFGAGLAFRAGMEAVSAARAVSVVFKTGAKVEVALASARIDSSLARRAVEHLIRSRLQAVPAVGTKIEGFVEIEGRVLKVTAGVNSTGQVVVGGIRVVR